MKMAKKQHCSAEREYKFWRSWWYFYGRFSTFYQQLFGCVTMQHVVYRSLIYWLGRTYTRAAYNRCFYVDFHLNLSTGSWDICQNVLQGLALKFWNQVWCSQFYNCLIMLLNRFHFLHVIHRFIHFDINCNAGSIAIPDSTVLIGELYNQDGLTIPNLKNLNYAIHIRF